MAGAGSLSRAWTMYTFISQNMRPTIQEDRLMGWRTLTGPSTDVEPQGAGKKVFRDPGPQADMLIFDLEILRLWSSSHGRPRVTLCAGTVMKKGRLSWCLGPT